jgi:uncharacterized membrane protein
LSKRNRNRELQSGTGQSQTIIASRQQLRIGPLPTPEELAHFDQVLPGLAERIVTMAELNGIDRRRNNRTIRWVTMLGPVFAFIIMMTALGGGFYLVNMGKDAAGITAIITAIGVPLGTFIYSRTRPQHPQ